MTRLVLANPEVAVIVDGNVRLDPGVALAAIHPDRVVEVAVFPDQVWVAQRCEAGAELVRFGHRGAPLGAPLALPWNGGPGRLLASPLHACATWTAGAAHLVVDSDGQLALTAASTSPVRDAALDLAIPISPARALLIRGGVISLRVGGLERWRRALLEPSARAVHGTALFDGSSAVVVASGDTGAITMMVIAVRDGSLQQRFTLTATAAVSVAARRGHALVQIDAHRLLLLDLRFGRTIGEHVHPRPIAAAALDPTGYAVAVLVRDGDGSVIERGLARDWFAAVGAVERPVEPVEAVTTTPDVDDRRDPPADQAPAPPPPPITLVDPPALRPRSRTQRANKVIALQLLERERTRIAALCYRATAAAWDTGRIVWANEGEHPFETELLGVLGRQRGRAGNRLAEAEAGLSEARNALAAIELAAQGTLTPLDELTLEFGLTPLARSILLIVAAPTIWGEIARLYGMLANDAERSVVDEMMVRQVIGPSVGAHDIARELDPERALLRHGLIRAGGGMMRPFLSLHVEPLVIKRLRGDVPGAGADPHLAVIAASRPLSELTLPADLAARLTELAEDRRDAPVRIVVRGRVGSGRRTLLAALAATANRELAILDAAPMLREGKLRPDALRDGLTRAALGGWLPCVDGLDMLGHDDRPQRELVREVLRAHPGPLALRLGSDVTPPLDPGHVLLDLPPLSEGRRLEVWRATLAAHQLAPITDDDCAELAARWVVGPGVVHRVAERVARMPPGDGETSPMPRLDLAIRQHLESRLGDSATRVARLSSWAEVVLPPDVVDSLLELVARIRHRRTVYERWGFDRVMSTSRGLTALFQGGPGTGKTMVAGAIARELGLDVYRVDLARIVSKWIGETERNLAQVFDAAEDGHAIILFDEADSLFAKRTEVKTSVDRYANLEVNYLLQRLDSFGGIAILTTNFGGGIDAAFKRRLSFRLSFPFPDEEMREQLWRVHLPAELPRAGDLDLAELARRYKMSGGYIRNATLRAAFLAAAEQSPLRQEHLERAVKLEYREIGKLADTGALE